MQAQVGQPELLNEVLNKKALEVISRVQEKLTGRDQVQYRIGAVAPSGGDEEPLTVKEQVNRLISEATSHENLCQCWIGWCPFW